LQDVALGGLPNEKTALLKRALQQGSTEGSGD
jgi:hypothetical protein